MVASIVPMRSDAFLAPASSLLERARTRWSHLRRRARLEELHKAKASPSTLAFPRCSHSLSFDGAGARGEPPVQMSRSGGSPAMGESTGYNGGGPAYPGRGYGTHCHPHSEGCAACCGRARGAGCVLMWAT